MLAFHSKFVRRLMTDRCFLEDSWVVGCEERWHAELKAMLSLLAR